MDKLISIIIPTYNRASLISETLKSILAQEYTNWECILVDDHSTDNTVAVVNEYVKKDDRFQLFTRPSNLKKGPNSCRNVGYKFSKGYYIYWFDSDDILIPEALNERIKAFNETTDMVVAKAVFFDSVTGATLFTNTIQSEQLIEDYFCGAITFYVSGPLWKKTFLEQQVCLFDESIRYLDDWDFNLRMLYQNPNIIYINAPLFKYRSHPNSLSKQINYLNVVELKSEIKARNKHLSILIRLNMVSPAIKKYLLSRYYIIFRDTLVAKTDERFYFFKQALFMQLRFGHYYKALKIILGYFVFRISHRGYFLIK